MTKFPIPDAALDDRLAILGTAGSGKTYLALTAVERLLARAARVVLIDPLGVGWGLRLQADGKTASPFNIPIFGGAHGDIGLTEHAGGIIGETVAKMRESCIIDLSGIGTKAGERRFMLAFLTALYRNATKDPVHLILDEADMFAPQRLMDRDGDAARLLGMMETIVRRGRVAGFIPWLITQRPAVLSKDVLSQADGLVALKLTSSQDRDAIGAWIEGQADKADAKAILASLPGMERGQGVVWLPGRAILETARFPAKTTFDSSRTPKRGEKRQATELKPLDLGALKDRLATVEAETKANDPRALKSALAAAQTELAKLRKAPAASAPAGNRDTAGLNEARATLRAYRTALEAAMKFIIEINAANFFKAGAGAVDKAALEKVIADAVSKAGSLVEAKVGQQEREIVKIRDQAERIVAKLKAILEQNVTVQVEVTHNEPFTIKPCQKSQPLRTAARPAASRQSAETDGLTNSQRRVLASIGFWQSIGTASPTRAQVGGVAGYSPSSGGFNNLLGQLNGSGLIVIPSPGLVALAPGAPFDPLSTDEAKAKVYSVISAPQRKLVDATLRHAEPMTRDDLGEATGYSPSSGGFNNLIGSLCTLTILEKPAPGMVSLSAWAREVLG